MWGKPFGGDPNGWRSFEPSDDGIDDDCTWDIAVLLGYLGFMLLLVLVTLIAAPVLGWVWAILRFAVPRQCGGY